MERIELAAALGVPEILPVGGFVAGTLESGFLDEGLEQHRTVSIAGLPVIGQPAADKGQDARGQILVADPRQDEETRIIDDEVQVPLSLCGAPADSGVAGFRLPGRGPKAQAGVYAPSSGGAGYTRSRAASRGAGSRGRP